MQRVHQTHKRWLSNNNMNITQGLNENNEIGVLLLTSAPKDMARKTKQK